jgi:CDP-diacylglycerol---glycerol-3-phosphate 3-phosphatidyltransferase
MTIANYLTFIRIFISPIFMLIYIEHDNLGISTVLLPYVLLFLMGISELSDAFDGYFARKYNQVTDLGKVLDPMADSIARISVFLTFTLPPVSIPVPLIFIFIYRDSIVSTLRTICALRGFALAARISGKIKAVIQAIVAFIILLLMIPYSLGSLSAAQLQTVSLWLASLAVVYTVFSAIDYIYANRHYIYKLLTPEDSI